jgi:hypothetical protein
MSVDGVGIFFEVVFPFVLVFQGNEFVAGFESEAFFEFGL